MKKRELTEQERAEWHEELHGRSKPKPTAKITNKQDKAPPRASASPKLLEGRAAKKQLKPHGKPQAVLDLHGLGKLDAYDKTRTFLKRAQAAGKRHVLIVTGKGKGILRDGLRKWLEDAPELVSSMSYAPPEKGGEGALHVLVRKKP